MLNDLFKSFLATLSQDDIEALMKDNKPSNNWEQYYKGRVQEILTPPR